MLLPVLLIFIFCVFIYLKFIKPCFYWKNKGIKYAKSWPGVGSLGRFVFKKETFADVAINLYQKYPQERYVGYQQFRQQCLLLCDIDLIQQITVKEIDNFASHAKFRQNLDCDPLLSKSLIGLTGKNWQNLRDSLNPIFTNNKIQNLYFLLDESAKNFVDHFNDEIDLEMKDTFLKIICNVIGSVAFGIEINCFKDLKNDFFKRGLQISKLTTWQNFKLNIWQTYPKLAKKLGMKIFSLSTVNFFTSIIKENIKKRETEGFTREDLIQLLLEARKENIKSKIDKKEFDEAEEDKLAKSLEFSDDYIVAQAITLLIAGFDTVSTTCSFMAYELAVNPEIQRKLQNEIDSVWKKNNGQFSYEAISGIKYLDQVVSETLRKWPPVFETDRLCTRDYQILPKRDDEKAFLVRKGVDVVIPIMAIHKNPQYYPEPERFDPERFSNENKSKIIPGTYLPFGCGPRNCIGSRLALLEIKTIFCHLLTKFEIIPIPKTQIPIKIKKGQISLVPENGFWLGFKPRKTNI